MKILHTFEELKELKSDIVCALGTFDGVHKGHYRVINQAVEKAKELNATPLVVTFDKHPFTVLKPSQVPPILCSNHDKFRFIEDLGISYALVLPMSEQLMKMRAEIFIRLLVEHNGVKAISVGENFTFGYKGEGDISLLKAYSDDLRFELIDNNLQTLHKTGDIISSSAIRHAIENGEMKLANNMLGRPFTFEGTVIQGDQRGRLLGFPTANFIFPEGIVIPKDGVYVNRVLLDGHIYNGIGNVGDNPTFSNQYHRLEVHILNFAKDIYGKKVRIEFLHFLRSEEKFSSLEDLIEQMNKDLKNCETYLSNMDTCFHC